MLVRQLVAMATSGGGRGLRTNVFLFFAVLALMNEESKCEQLGSDVFWSDG